MEIRVITCNFHPSGIISVLEGVRQFDDLVMCGNLRDTVQRLLPFDGVKEVGLGPERLTAITKKC